MISIGQEVISSDYQSLVKSSVAYVEMKFFPLSQIETLQGPSTTFISESIQCAYRSYWLQVYLIHLLCCH